MTRTGKVLVLTVGTGDIGVLEASLIEPVSKSIRTGEWEQVILLPSAATRGFADIVTVRFPGLLIRILPLPEPGTETTPPRMPKAQLPQPPCHGSVADPGCRHFVSPNRALSFAGVRDR